MTHWDYLNACVTIATRTGVKLLVKWNGGSHWGRCLEGGRIGDFCLFNVDLDTTESICITHREVIRFMEDGEEKPWPRYENDGQSRLF